MRVNKGANKRNMVELYDCLVGRILIHTHHLEMIHYLITISKWHFPLFKNINKSTSGWGWNCLEIKYDYRFMGIKVIGVHFWLVGGDTIIFHRRSIQARENS